MVRKGALEYHKRSYANGQRMSREEAIRIAASSSDASIVTSALVLFCATLGVSFVSSIDLIGAICVMLSRGALISALVSIFLMPAVLYVCEPLFNRTSLHWRTDPPPKDFKLHKRSKGGEKLPPSRRPERCAPPYLLGSTGAHSLIRLMN